MISETSTLAAGLVGGVLEGEDVEPPLLPAVLVLPPGPPPPPPEFVEAGVVTGVEDPLGPVGVVMFLGGGTIMLLLLGMGVVTTGVVGQLLVEEEEAGVVQVDCCERTVGFS